MSDNFKEYYDASARGWSARYCSQWKRAPNVDGLVEWLWRRENGNLEVHPYNSDTFFEFREKGPTRQIFGAQFGKKVLGYFETLKEAKNACEKAYAEAVIEFCPHCGAKLREQPGGKL